MSALLQAATEPHGMSFGELWRAATPFLLLLLGWAQKRSADDRKELRDCIKEEQAARIALEHRTTALEVHNAELRTHVGVDGSSGIIAKLDAVVVKLDKIADEMAENRGSAQRRGNG